MRAGGRAGRVALALGAGMLGALAGLQARDDRYVAGRWRTLEQAAGAGGVFTEERLVGLPDAAQRYFRHAIRLGTPLAARLRWRYAGRLKPGARLPWLALRAEQVLAQERGFVWRARAWAGPLVLRAVDHYLDGAGRMRIALWGLVPLVQAAGPDLARSARGRFVAECVALPSALLPGPHVRIGGLDTARFWVMVTVHGETVPLTLTVADDGRLQEVTLERWGNLTPDGAYCPIPYGVRAEGEGTFGGYTIPTRLAGGWWFGTARYQEVVRLNVDWARLE